MAINVSNFTKICIFGTCTSHLVPGHHIVSADIQLKMLVVLSKHLEILKNVQKKQICDFSPYGSIYLALGHITWQSCRNLRNDKVGMCNMPSIYDRISLPDKAGKRHINAGKPRILVACRYNLANTFSLDASWILSHRGSTMPLDNSVKTWMIGSMNPDYLHCTL